VNATLRAGLRRARNVAADSIATVIERLPGLEPAWARLGSKCFRIPGISSLYGAVVDRVVASHQRAGRSTYRAVRFADRTLRVDVADFTTKWQYFGQRTYEPETTRHILSALSPGDTFVDVGAHHGYYTLLAASVVGDSGRVAAFEPQPAACESLSRACAENGYQGRVEIVAAAAGAAAGEATLFVYPAHDAFTSLVAPEETPAPFLGDPSPIKVRVDTLDRWRRNSNVPAVRGIKIDVEKAELSVLDGMQEMLTHGLVDWVVCETTITGPAHDRLVSYGYRARILDFWGPGYGNVLFERREPANSHRNR
jgi:FkbM family methyltransferase